MACLITSLTLVYSTIIQEIKEHIKAPRHWLCEENSPVNSPHKWPVTRKKFPFDVVIVKYGCAKPVNRIIYFEHTLTLNYANIVT